MLPVSVSDGELSSSADLTINVLANGLCGATTRTTPVRIDGTANNAQLPGGGVGTSANPYVIPIKGGCGDFTFIYDPNYTTSSPTVYFAMDIEPGTYQFSVILETDIMDGVEPSAFDFSLRDLDGNTFFADIGFIDFQTAPRTSLVSEKPVISSRVIMQMDGDEKNRKWLTPQGFSFQKQ